MELTHCDHLQRQEIHLIYIKHRLNSSHTTLVIGTKAAAATILGPKQILPTYRTRLHLLFTKILKGELGA